MNTQWFFIIVGIICIPVGLFTDAGYEWFTTRFQREFISREVNKVMTVILGIIMILLGIFLPFP